MLRRALQAGWGSGPAYSEHVAHARDTRVVPLQRLVEAGGILPDAEGC